MQEFFETLAKNRRLAEYGYKNVKKAFEYRAVSKLLISEAEDDKIMDELEELADQSKAETFVISTQTQEGQQLRDLGKVAVILRFPLN
mgnify:CR=1 FL=1